MTGSAGPRPDRYGSIGRSYRHARREDPRLAARIHAALGTARTVVNVGTGTGSCEPRQRTVVAVEPSWVMVAQRPPGSAPGSSRSPAAGPAAQTPRWRCGPSTTRPSQSEDSPNCGASPA